MSLIDEFGDDSQFLSHLDELRSRIINVLILLFFFSLVIYLFHDKLLSFLISPIEKLIFISPLEVFITRIKVSFFGGFLLSVPFIFFHIWRFILPACYENEKKHFAVIIISSLILFICGVLVAYFIALPLILNFLIGMGTDSLSPMITFSKYISFTVQLLIGFGLFAQMPLAVFYLVKFNILSIDTISSKRKYIIVLILILSAILTPPDIFSQLLITFPAYLLFEISLLLTAFLCSNKMD